MLATGDLRFAKWSLRCIVNAYGYKTLVVKNELKSLWGLNVCGWQFGWQWDRSVSQCVGQYFATVFSASFPAAADRSMGCYSASNPFLTISSPYLLSSSWARSIGLAFV